MSGRQHDARVRRSGSTAARPRRGTARGSSAVRLRLGFLVIAVVLSVFAGRLVQLQGLDPNSYAAMAAAEGTAVVTLPATRGEILDRDGEPLADSVAGLMIIADPQLTAAQAPALATLLARRLDLDYVETLERLRAPDSQFQYLARQLPAAQAQRVVDEATEAGFAGLTTRDDPLRTYPAKDVAANVLGFLGRPSESGRARPLAGLEATFGDWLAGQDGEARYQVGDGNRLPLGESTLEAPEDGEDLTTTLDANLQWYVQRSLRDTVRRAGGESGVAVVMDAGSGEVLALADHPTYDASDPEATPDEGLFKSRAATDVYEPGSVEKVLTMASLIDAGKITMDTRFTVPSQLPTDDGTVVHDYFEHDELRLTTAGVVAKSSNIGTVLAARRFEEGQLRSYLDDFGITRRTGVGLAGEPAGLLPSPAAWTTSTAARIAFGQSLSVTALQMTAAVNTIANGGVRVDPSIIEGSAVTDAGVTVGTEQATSRRVVSEEAARQTTLMMEQVLDPEAGVAPAAQVPGYRVAGKTGTAQRVNEDGFYDGSTTVSFGGFAPADDPRLTVYVAVHDPRAGSGGGSTAGPAFARMMGVALRHYGIPPTGSKPEEVATEWGPRDDNLTR